MGVRRFLRKFAVDALLRGRGLAVTVGVVIRCTVRATSDRMVRAVSGRMHLGCIAIDQLGSGLIGYLGGGNPARKCFKPLVEKSLHGVGIFQQDFEHPRSVGDLGHLVDLYARA